MTVGFRTALAVVGVGVAIAVVGVVEGIAAVAGTEGAAVGSPHTGVEVEAVEEAGGGEGDEAGGVDVAVAVGSSQGASSPTCCKTRPQAGHTKARVEMQSRLCCVC